MEARRIRIKGIVQGVGFRPFVYRLANRLGIAGTVLNDSEGVLIVAEGTDDALDMFVESIEKEAPKPSTIAGITIERTGFSGFGSFKIIPSEHADGEATSISPDLATCEDCLRELFDPDDRRYKYPFINCTHCGPRYGIIRGLPYDRPKTSMAGFEMCEDCRSEYGDVLDRRFHAQPNACDVCGPRYELLDADGVKIDCRDPIGEASLMLNEGKIIAVKGIGGFHLMADPMNISTVERLRARKGRPQKPFALMVGDTGVAGMLCELSDAESAALESPAAPIILLKKRKNPPIEIPESIAPGLDTLGVFLPYAPVHHLLLAGTGLPILIATSGNRRDEPVVCDNDEALRDLRGIADAFLVHNREIVGRTDDSVGLVFDGEIILTRRSRGFVPAPMMLPVEGPSILAVGADLKGTFALTRGNQAFLSPYLGDMAGEKSIWLFHEVLERYLDWLEVEPKAVICDLHPDYAGTVLAERIAEDKGLPLYRVQHHFAHALSVMAEHRLADDPAIAITLDGLGYGADGTIWGGEFLVVGYDGFERKAHILNVVQPGGDRAAVDVSRMALSWGYEAFGDDVSCMMPFLFDKMPDFAEPLLGIIERRRAPITSSAGRLFDAVACIAGICDKNTFEAECPQKLMSAVDISETGAYPFDTNGGILDPGPAIRAIVKESADSVPPSVIAARFHRGFAEGIVELAAHISAERDIKRVLLSGGVFQNRILLSLVVEGLNRAGLSPLWNREVPPGDAGIALGQALYGISRIQRTS